MATRRNNPAVSERQRAALLQMVIGKWISQAIAAAVDMGVPDQLAKGARRSSDNGKLLDLNMLVLTPRGRERTKLEFAALLKAAGFRLSRIVPTESPLSVVEAVK